MGYKINHILFFTGLLLLGNCLRAPAQDTTQFGFRPPATDSADIIHLLNADELMGIQPGKSDSNQLQKLRGNVFLRQGQTFFSCDSALQNLTQNTIDAYGHIHINQADTIQTYADFLHYEGNVKVATLRQNVRLEDSEMTLTTNLLNYDMDSHIGSYMNGGKLVNKSTVLTSRRGYYYADTKDVYFKSDVQLTDPEYTLATDTLLYNTFTRIATFQAPTTINTGSSIIHTACGYYSTTENYAHLCDRSVIIDSSRQLTADSMNYHKSTGIGVAYGNVIWSDTAQHMTVLANYAVSDQMKKTIMATQKPLLILEREKDTLYTAADTLFSGVLPRPLKDTSRFADTLLQKPAEGFTADSQTTGPLQDTAQTSPPAAPQHELSDSILQKTADSPAAEDTADRRYVIAYHHVRLFSDSLQGVADSLYYSDIDSAFRFYKDPVLWTGVTQLTGDTIVLLTRDQQADRILLQQHAMIVNEAAPGMYNQIKGTIITGYFKEDNAIDWMSVDGNAESLYYAQDDNNAFVGGNHSTSARIHLYFKDGTLNTVVMIKDVDAAFTPPTKIPEEEKKLNGFLWEENRRPKTKASLME